jgi:hypothetical protein
MILVMRLVSKTGLREKRYDDGSLVELTQDDVQWCRLSQSLLNNYISHDR